VLLNQGKQNRPGSNSSESLKKGELLLIQAKIVRLDQRYYVGINSRESLLSPSRRERAAAMQE
jgi:hypothetical protein